jgi:hypothetical protein
MDPTPNQEAGTQGTLLLGSNRRDVAAGVHMLQPSRFLWGALGYAYGVSDRPLEKDNEDRYLVFV